MTSYRYELADLEEPHGLGCSCCRYQDGTDLPVPAKLSYDEIKKHARIFSADVLRNWVSPNAIMKRLEGRIIKRWTKKSQKQRREILLTAVPDMPTFHRPDFSAFRDKDDFRNVPRSRTLITNAFLWPYINLEDLQQGQLLLMFLKSRGRTLPQHFTMSDFKSAHLGHGWQGIVNKATSCMHFLGGKTPSTYGQLRKAAVVGKIENIQHTFPAILGLLVLEIQQHTYSFLVKVATLILHDIAPERFVLDPHQPEPPLPTPSLTQWPNLASHMLESQYRAPAKMDLERLKLIVSARRSTAEEHLWQLRENPGYFQDTLLDWREHNENHLEHKCIDCWSKLAHQVVSEAFRSILFWDFIYKRLNSLPPLDDQIRRANYKTLRLPKKEEEIWMQVMKMTELMIKGPIDLITLGFHVAPRMRHCFNTAQKVAERGRLWDPKRKLSQAENRVELLFAAMTNFHLRNLHDLPKIVNETQYMLDTDPAASALVDSWLLNQFSELATLCHIKESIFNLQPWFTSMDYADVDLKEGIQILVQAKVLEDIWSALFANRDLMVTALGDPNDGQLDYPVAKRPTEVTIKQMRIAEQRPDEFWTWLTLASYQCSRVNIEVFIEVHMLVPRSLDRTPEWKAPKAVKDVPAPFTSNAATTRAAPFPVADVRKENVKPAAEKVKVKVKTRGVPAPPIDDAAAAPDDPVVDVGAPPEKVRVPKRAWKVLSAVFPEPGAASDQRCEVAWEDFLSAMNAIGLAPEKLYGSVWVFTPKEMGQGGALLPLERSIQFHEPKEVRRGNKIPHFMVRAFGRRLKHAYGWEDGMFVCE